MKKIEGIGPCTRVVSTHSAGARSNASKRERCVSGSRRLLCDVFGADFELPEPSAFSRVALPAQVSGTNSRPAAKRAQLRQLAIAYAFFVLIYVSGRAKAYYAELAKEHTLSRTDGDKIGWILRSVMPLPRSKPKERDRARHDYSAWATAIRFCIRKGILPDQVVVKGTPQGQGLSYWAHEQQAYRKQAPGSKTSGPAAPRKRSVREAADKVLSEPGARGLIEISRWTKSSSRVRAVRYLKLPTLRNPEDRRELWSKIEEAIATVSSKSRRTASPKPRSGAGKW
jgi:hypothetical protein